MNSIIDASGLSCPQPVLMVMDKIKEMGSGEIVVIVDTDTSKENVSRAATSKGWNLIDVRAEGQGYRLTIKKE